MSVEPLTRTDLDSMLCADPACLQVGHVHPHLVLRSGCHQGKPQIVRYWGDGVVEVRCKICNLFVLSVAVSNADRAELNAKLECTEPDCKHPPAEHKLLIAATCHQGAGLFVIYNKGRLTFACSRCRTPMSGVGVREGTVH